MYRVGDSLADQETRRELQLIAQELENLRSMRVLHNAPLKPRDGNFCICDGVNWNPLGDGIKRPIWFDQTAGLWKRFDV
jgi:hypothetical protein